MGLFNTDGEKVATERFGVAHKTLKGLMEYLELMDKAMANRKEGGFPVTWPAGIFEKALVIQSEISRGNGALLVRGTDPEEKS